MENDGSENSKNVVKSDEFVSSRINNCLGLIFDINMPRLAIEMVASAVCLLSVMGCAQSAGTATQVTFAPIKRDFVGEQKCIFEHRLSGVKRPIRGIIEGDVSLINPDWELYVVDLDAMSLSKIESVWNFENGKIVTAPNRLQTIDLGRDEIRDIAALANSMWADTKRNPSQIVADVAWNIDLIDGQQTKCQSGLGVPSGDGGTLVRKIYTVWGFGEPSGKCAVCDK